MITQEAVEELRRKHYNATLVWQKHAHSDLQMLRVKPDVPIATHSPGQYGTLGLGNWEPRVAGCQTETLAPGDEERLVRRAYSISCSILDEQGQLWDTVQDWLEFYVVLVRETEGKPPALTPRLFMLKPGDRLFLGTKITGHYTTETVKPNDAVLFLSTGTGEAPHNYMLWELLKRGHQGRILSACCVRYRRDLAYLATQETLMARYPNYIYLPLTTRESVNLQHKVYIQDLLTSGQLEEKLGQALDPAHTHVYLCGNPKMIGVPAVNRETGERTFPAEKGVIELLEQRGFRIHQPHGKTPGNIHFEEYW